MEAGPGRDEGDVGPVGVSSRGVLLPACKSSPVLLAESPVLCHPGISQEQD